MSATQTSLDALAAHTRKRSDAVRTRIDKAIKALRRERAAITISSVARRAGVTHKASTPVQNSWRSSTRTGLWRPSPTTSRQRPAPTTASSPALRARLTAKDAQIAELKAALRDRDHTIAALHGELDRHLR